MSEELLPWHGAPWHRLVEARQGGRMPHALLLCGAAGLGKARFAHLLAHALLCTAPRPDGTSCGACRGCQLIQADTHPDLRWVAPLEDKTVIGVDQIREISDFLSLHSHYAGHKIVVIVPAERMNANAANSLLKTLEEPPPEAILLLVSSRPAEIPATVRSRCQRVPFGIPPLEEALAWLDARDGALLLALAGGAPLAAKAIAEGGVLEHRRGLLGDLERLTDGAADPLEVAARWLKLGLKESLYWVYGWLGDMIRLKTAGRPPYLVDSDARDVLQRIAGRFDIIKLFNKLDTVTRAVRAVDTPLNAQLLMEDLLLGWAPPPVRGRPVAGAR